MDYLTGTGLILLGGIAGATLYFWRGRSARCLLDLREKTLLETTERETQALRREIAIQNEAELLNLRTAQEASFHERQQRLMETERLLLQREALVTHQLTSVSEEQTRVAQDRDLLLRQRRELDREHEALLRIQEELKSKLATLTQMDAQQARDLYLEQIRCEASQDAALLCQKITQEAKTHAEEKARAIISTAIQRYASQHTFENTSCTVSLPSDEIKGRIIGREGRNIRAFEAATGITVLIDDTPNAVVLSGFDPVRREVAREAMQRLILDGRIHPTRIDEVVATVNQEMSETILRAGEEALIKVGVPPMPRPIVEVLGRLRFRMSYNQNILDHSVEVAHLTGLLASELGLDVTAAKKAGLLHDIGKAMDHEIEGSHALIGADLLRRHGESELVVNGVASHHNEVPGISPLGVLVGAADAISASRPGARSESQAIFIRRVENLEKMAMAQPGVEKCYAIQAGRELRVIVQPEKVSDAEAQLLAKTLARKIEDEMQYPGQIRITVMRETKCVEYAK